MWRVYYDDGETFSSTDGRFEDAPTDGVLFILQKCDGRIVTLSGHDHYAMIDGEIIAVSDIAALLRKVGWIKMGRWTSFKTFEEVGRRVARDANLMAKDNGN